MDIRRHNLIVGDSPRLLGAVVLLAIIGATVTRVLLEFEYPEAFVFILSIFFLISVYMSFKGGKGAEPFILFSFTSFSFYLYQCESGLPIWNEYIRPFPHLLSTCPVAGANPPALDVVIIISILISFFLSIVSIGLGKIFAVSSETY